MRPNMIPLLSLQMDSELHTHTVRSTEAGARIDSLIARIGIVPSRSFGTRLAGRGLVKANGRMVKPSYVARAGDFIEILLPPPVETSLVPENLPLDIRFEDEYMIVLNKAAGMVVHPTDAHRTGTLVHALLAHADKLGSLGGVERPGIVHRLDKDTSGLMIVAKDDKAQAVLSEAIRIRAVDRRYCTLVHGLVAHDKGLIDAPIGRHAKDRMRMAVSYDPAARQAVTNFSVLERFDTDYHDDGFSLLECKLHTGRTHQIRVHMAFIDHHVVGDQTYGRRHHGFDLDLKRQFLHSYRLSLEHPITGEKLEFEDGLPDDFLSVLDGIVDRSMGETEYGMGVMGTIRARKS